MQRDGSLVDDLVIRSAGDSSGSQRNPLGATAARAIAKHIVYEA